MLNPNHAGPSDFVIGPIKTEHSIITMQKHPNSPSIDSRQHDFIFVFSHDEDQAQVKLSIPIMADEEPVDQKKYFEDLCKSKCVKEYLAYQSCVKRIEGDESGHKHCTGQYFDYWSCVDKCVAPRLFEKLK